MSTSLKRGFTLIELLVVIAIIGLLSAIVLGALNSARGKGADASARADLLSMRSQAELVFDKNNPGGYSGSTANVCTDTNIIQGINAASSVELGSLWWVSGSGTNTGDVGCKSAPGSWMVWIHLLKNSGGYWCVDSNGNSKSETSSPNLTGNTCP